MKRLLTALLVLTVTNVPAAQGPKLIVLNKSDATLVVVDPATRKILGSVPTGEGPHEVTVSDDGRTAFVANYGAQTPGSTLSVIDLVALKELKRVDLAPLARPHGVIFNGGAVYFTAETNRVVARYAPTANKIDWVFGTGQTGTHMIWVSPDATKIYTCNIGADSLTALERGATPLAWTATVIPVGKGPEGFDVSPDGRELWAAHSRDGGVSIVNLEQKKVAATLDLQTKRSNRLKFTPDGSRVLISDLDAGELLVIDVASRTLAKKIPLGRMVEGILVQPDGARAYVAVTGDNHVAIVDMKTLEVLGKIEPGNGPDGMAWVR